MRLNPQYVIIGAVIGAFIVSTIAQNVVQKNAFLLDRDLRERIWKRETKTYTWWRFLETAGIVAMIAGLLKMAGFIPSTAKWGIPAMAIGFTVICLATSLRTWLSNKAYTIEAPGTPASRSAFNAALWVTVTEVSLGCMVCWFVFSPSLPGSRSNSSSGGNSATPPTQVSPAQPAATKDALWVNETEALRLLKGKDAAYLKALVAREDIRAREQDGKTEYRRDDISAMKIAGLPSIEELEASLAERRKNAKPAEELPAQEKK